MRYMIPAATATAGAVVVIIASSASTASAKSQLQPSYDRHSVWQQSTIEQRPVRLRPNISQLLRNERTRAEELWRQGRALLWFQHIRRAGGTTLCKLLHSIPGAEFAALSEACQPEEWKLRDAVAICDHNLSLVADEVEIIGGNSFAQEYGPMPAQALLGRRTRPTEARMREWMFVLTMREPWSRFWSQLKYEMATCLARTDFLAKCMGGDFEAIGHWWSPTAHPDSVLGVPGARISPTPKLYVDNYYTRILLNRTDVENAPKLTTADFENAKMLLRDRVSAVLIVEDFGRTGLQLACSLGMDVDHSLPLLRTRVRPYEAQESLMSVPQDESAMGSDNMEALRSRFVSRNKFDYALYSYARLLSKRRLFECARKHPGVRKLWRAPASEFQEEVKEKPAKPADGDPLPPELSIDDLFGCTGGRLDFNDTLGEYTLWCPRSATQHASSWWKSKSTDGIAAPKRKKGQRLKSEDCWQLGFTYAACCNPSFGPEGNEECWGGQEVGAEFTYQRCCIADVA